MSVYQAGIVWDYQLGRSERLVALALADSALEDGTGIIVDHLRLEKMTDIPMQEIHQILHRFSAMSLLVPFRDRTKFDPPEYAFDWSAVPLKSGVSHS